MMYVDIDYYVDRYEGKAPVEEFYRLENKASAYLDRITFERISCNTPEKIMRRVRNACCAVIDALYLNESGGGIVSETNDGISVTYANAKVTKSDEQRLYEAASLYLSGTGLLYRGVN